MSEKPEPFNIRPSTPVLAGAAAGVPLAQVLVWALDTYLLPVPMPAYIAAAIGSLIVAGASYLTRGGRRARTVAKE